jgi:mono/diheme cytochrome c family protein
MKPGLYKSSFEEYLRGRCANSAWVVVLLAVACGCHRDMYDQPRFEPLEASEFFADQRSARPRVAGTVAYRAPAPGDVRQTGRVGDQLVDEIPIPVDLALLRRGQERFDIYCSVCHGRTGVGDGMIVERGYKRPPTYHSDRLRGLPIGHFFEVITQGYGVMPSYATQVAAEDRWAIAAYIRALQLSQYANASELPEAARAEFQREGTP